MVNILVLQNRAQVVPNRQRQVEGKRNFIHGQTR